MQPVSERMFMHVPIELVIHELGYQCVYTSMYPLICALWLCNYVSTHQCTNFQTHCVYVHACAHIFDLSLSLYIYIYIYNMCIYIYIYIMCMYVCILILPS